ncbi:hypothetical protein [Mycobacterium sp. M23085]|uniref:hypothetical protein n=1 Tax=Mycobacterium sp. M23085 TaxID=3378087 RepID=UPI003877EAB4
MGEQNRGKVIAAGGGIRSGARKVRRGAKGIQDVGDVVVRGDVGSASGACRAVGRAVEIGVVVVTEARSDRVRAGRETGVGDGGVVVAESSLVNWAKPFSVPVKLAKLLLPMPAAVPSPTPLRLPKV